MQKITVKQNRTHLQFWWCSHSLQCTSFLTLHQHCQNNGRMSHNSFHMKITIIRQSVGCNAVHICQHQNRPMHMLQVSSTGN